MRRLAAVLLVVVSTGTHVDGQLDQRISADERRALIAIFAATKGQAWHNHTGWGSAVGSECDWYGVECGEGHVIALRLQENGLAGEIPSEALALKWLTSVWLWRNNLTAVPGAWEEREDRGQFDLRLWNNPIPDRVTEISIEENEGSLLCSHAMLRIRDDAIEMASVKCRNETEDDRQTYCEMKRFDTHGVSDLRRLARFIEKQGFYNLKHFYTVNQTHAGTTTVRVTREGHQQVVEDYGYLEPLELFGIQSAIRGMAPPSWDVVQTKSDADCEAFFRSANDTLVVGLTFTLQLPPDVTEKEVGGEHYSIRDAVGELFSIDTAFSRPEPSILLDVPLTNVTLNAGPAMQHERRANGVASREIILKGETLSAATASMPEAAWYTRLRYANLPEPRAKVADSIIDTLRRFSWR